MDRSKASRPVKRWVTCICSWGEISLIRKGLEGVRPQRCECRLVSCGDPIGCCEVGRGGHLGSHEVRTGVKGGNTFLPHPDTTLEKRGGNIGRRDLETFGDVEY